MKFSVLTIFPNIIKEYINSSIIKKAINNNYIFVDPIDIREYSTNKNKSIDDYGYGGNSGIVMQIEPIVAAIRDNKTEKSLIVNLVPHGKKFNQSQVENLIEYSHIILICGHYEGIDSRIENYVDINVSIGDFVLTGGELPALVVIDAISRKIPGVINKTSLMTESFDNNLLDFPVYTKPINFEGYTVPGILLSGHHDKIKLYRFNEQLERTKKFRKDLYIKYLNNERNNNEN
ncbi:MAG: tRNA (guanosine(37)-N1)-methyltransferase TrmD [Mycoplasmoidaceae bacterium]